METAHTENNISLASIPERWVMSRAIFYNFWYYPNQELVFKDGCAVLRGHNGSGKSVTTQALITVLLDGDTSSNRLDPFGTRDRKIMDTVLGEKSLLGIDKRTGYLALEFRKGNTKVTKTIGMGIEADRTQKNPKIWYFVINGKQIGDEEQHLNLYKNTRLDGKPVQIPLNEKELTVEIEQRYLCGKVYKDRISYANAVNKGLFGFDSLNSYEGLMRLLIQARNPKLSDSSKPEVAASVLNDSLPQLTEDELRPLTSSIEAIDRLEKDLKSYKKDYKAIKELSDAYTEYLEVISAEKGSLYGDAQKAYEKTKKLANEAMKQLETDKESLWAAQATQRKVSDELENSRRERAELGLQEIEGMQERKEQEERNLEKFTKRYDQAKTKEREAATLHSTFFTKQQESESKMMKKERELKEFLLELKNNASETDYQQHQRFEQHFRDNQSQPDYSFTAWEKSFKQYKEYVQKTKTALEKWDHLKKQALELENSIGLVRMKADESQRKVGRLEDEYEEEIQSLKEQQANWAEASIQLDVPRDILDDLSTRMEEVFDGLSVEAYLTELQQHVNSLKEEVQERLLVNRVQIQQAEKENLVHLGEIQKWENVVEVEPSFIQPKAAEWKALNYAGISFQPFYEAFDFKEGISSEEKIRIQNALYEAGILASVVVRKLDVADASNYTTVLKYQEEKPNNLSEVLIATEDESHNALLKGIGFSANGNGFVLSTGEIDTNFITGNSSIFDHNLYIGKMAREEYRNLLIGNLQEMINENQNTIQKWNDENEMGAMCLLRIEKEYKRFPSVYPLQDLLTAIASEKRKVVDIYEVDIQEKTKAVSLLQKQMETLKRGMDSNEVESNLPLELNVFETELSLMNDYGECLIDIQNTYKDMSLASEQAIAHLATAEMQKEYEIEHQEVALEAEHELTKTRSAIANYTKRLEQIGSEDILAEVEKLSHKINVELPAKNEAAIRQEQDLKKTIKDGEMAVIEFRDHTMPFELKMVEAWEQAFREQVLSSPLEFESETGSLMQKANELKDRFKEKLTRPYIEQVKKRLMKKFRDQHIELIAYELEMDEQQSDYLPTLEDMQDSSQNAHPLNENQQQKLELAAVKMPRILITMSMDDLRMSPLAVAVQLAEKINSLQVDANKKDLDLYEEILINTLGENIRQKIHYVERWEKEMNKFMEHKNNIKFRLKWMPKNTEADGELNTTELVKALKKDSRWIKTEDIARHFRSKIKAAKRGTDRNKEVNLQEVMCEVLDYRQWFEFEIYYTKVNDTEKRLNQKNYNSLSGGQRVLAMITPILAAIYAKYMDAREDAPRLFTLDEAFARMDDENTDIIFQYVHKMGFNYILNSQALWGCYESVPSLNIYELSRPNNRPFVSINSYYWNGHKRTSVGNEEIEIIREGTEPALV